MQNKKKILIVKHEAIAALALKNDFEKRGYEVITAYSGVEAIERFRAERDIELVLMDIDSGNGMDGIEAASMIPGIRDVPVIFLTDREGSQIVERAESIASYGFVVKDSGITVLDASIKTALRLFNERMGSREQELLRDSEEKYRVVFNNRHFAICIFDFENCRFLDVNDAFTHLYGYSRDELTGGMTTRDLAADINDSDKTVGLSAQKGGVFIPLRYHRKKDGTVFPVEIVGEKYKWRGREVVFGLINDITARKQSEELLKKNETRLQNILEGTNAGTWEWNVKTGETVFNERWAGIIGYTLEELQPVSIQTWMEFAHPDDLKKSDEMLQRHFSGELEFYSFESRMKHKDGSWVWVLDRGKVSDRDEYGSPVWMYGTHTDITELKRIQESFRESEEKYRLLVENSHDIIYTLNPEGIFTFVSPSWTVLLGHPVDRVTGHPFQPFVHPDDVQACMDFLGKVIVTGKPHEGVEYRVRHIDGTWRWHTSSAVALTDENGSVVEYEGIARDITEQKLAEEKIKALLAEKELILKEVHHRIRNNMSTICGLILLQIYSIKDESSANALRDTERRISSMMLLYDKLYRSENFNEISVADYIPPLVDEIVRNFPNSGKVNIIKKVDDFILSAKKVQSVGIIINELLTNIMKHAFTGRDSGLITVTAEVKDGKAVIIITDDGIGIPEGIDFSTSKGFGMQLVSMLTTQLRGKISIERGEGARFALEFEI